MERTKMRKSVRSFYVAVATTAATVALPPLLAHADLTGFWLTTPHPELAIRPGETDAIPLTLRHDNLPPQRADLEVTGVPQGWTWALKGGNNEIGAVIVSPNATEDVKLELTPPAGAKGERIPIDVKAHYGSETADLPL